MAEIGVLLSPPPPDGMLVSLSHILGGTPCQPLAFFITTLKTCKLEELAQGTCRPVCTNIIHSSQTD